MAMLIFLVALPTRLMGVVSDLPHSYDFDEAFNVFEIRTMMSNSTLRPGGHNYPQGHKYLVGTPYWLALKSGLLPDRAFTGVSGVPADTRVASGIGWWLLRLPAGLGSSAAVTFVFLAVWEILRRYGPAVFAAGLMLLAPLVLEIGSSRVAADPFVLTFGALATWFGARAIRRGGPREGILLAIAVGGATASKYNALIFGGFLGAWLIRELIPASGERPSPGRIRRVIALGVAGLVAAAATYLALSPYTFLDWAKATSDIRIVDQTYRLGRQGFEGRSWLFNTRTVFDNALVALPAAFVGAVAWRWMRWRTYLFVLGAVMTTLGGMAAQSRYLLRIDRNVMPLAAPAIAGGVVALAALLHAYLIRAGRRHSPVLVRRVVAGFVAVCLLVQGGKAMRSAQRVVVDERAEARAFLTRNVRTGDRLLIEAHAPLPDRGDVIVTNPGNLWDLFTEAGDEVQWDWVVGTSEQSANVLANRERYPDQIAADRLIWGSMCEVYRFTRVGVTIRVGRVNCDD